MAAAAQAAATEAKQQSSAVAADLAGFEQTATAAMADMGAGMSARIDALSARVDQVQATPGPAGSDGAPGKSVELRATATAVQWRQVGGTWADLVPLSAITGPAGQAGPAGAKGDPGPAGSTGPAGTPADMTRVAALETSVASLILSVNALQVAAGKLAAGQAAVPALLLGATTTVQVPLRPTLPDANLSASALVVGGTNVLSTLSVQSWQVVSGSRVDVTVKASGVLSAGAAQVLVIATRQ
ncbi:hypothetical protein AB0L22_08970 [Micromonospora haikouensis]|uniref:collagen-like triple helix repeat-containing protein n=1 Tax=Micromonospora haikouensis TaxID=686309 RepID=UPI003418DB36